MKKCAQCSATYSDKFKVCPDCDLRRRTMEAEANADVLDTVVDIGLTAIDIFSGGAGDDFDGGGGGFSGGGADGDW